MKVCVAWRKTLGEQYSALELRTACTLNTLTRQRGKSGYQSPHTEHSVCREPPDRRCDLQKSEAAGQRQPHKMGTREINTPTSLPNPLTGLPNGQTQTGAKRYRSPLGPPTSVTLLALEQVEASKRLGLGGETGDT